MVNKNYDLASAMDNVLNSEGHQKIFAAKPKTVIKEASKKIDVSNVKEAFNALLEVSAELDELGLSVSAEQILKAAYSVASEAGLLKTADHLKVNTELVKDDPEDAELDNLLKELGDNNEVMDVPSDKDKEEGNPENC